MVSETKVLFGSLFCAVSLACVAFAGESCKFDEYSGMMIVGDYSTKLVGVQSRKACLDVLAKNGDKYAAVAYNEATGECCTARTGDEYELATANGEWSTFKKATKAENEVDVADTMTTEANIEADIETTTVPVKEADLSWMSTYSELSRKQAGGVDIRIFYNNSYAYRLNSTMAEEYCKSIRYDLAQLDEPEVFKAFSLIMKDGYGYSNSYHYVPVGARYDDDRKDYLWTVSRTNITGSWATFNTPEENYPFVFINKNTNSKPELKYYNDDGSKLFYAFACTYKYSNLSWS